MIKKLAIILLALAVVAEFSLPVLAQEIIKGKIEALDKDAKKVTISGVEYSLSDTAVQAEVAVDDEVQATVNDDAEADAEGGIVITLIKQ